MTSLRKGNIIKVLKVVKGIIKFTWEVLQPLDCYVGEGHMDRVWTKKRCIKIPSNDAERRNISDEI